MPGSDIGKAPEGEGEGSKGAKRESSPDFERSRTEGKGERVRGQAVYDEWVRLVQGKQRLITEGSEALQPGALTRQEMEGDPPDSVKFGTDAVSSLALHDLPDSPMEPPRYDQDQGRRGIAERVARVNGWRQDVSSFTRGPESGIQETIRRVQERKSHLEKKISRLKGIESRLKEMGLPRVSEREGLNSQSAGLNRGQDKINQEKPDKETIEKQLGGWKIVESKTGKERALGNTMEEALHKAGWESASPPPRSSRASFQREFGYRASTALSRIPEDPEPSLDELRAESRRPKPLDQRRARAEEHTGHHLEGNISWRRRGQFVLSQQQTEPGQPQNPFERNRESTGTAERQYREQAEKWLREKFQPNGPAKWTEERREYLDDESYQKALEKFREWERQQGGNV